VLEFLAGLEVRDALRRHFYFFTGLGVSANPRVSLADPETAKSAHFQFVAGLERLDNTFEHGVDDDFRVFPRQLGNLGYFLNEICLGHDLLLLLNYFLCRGKDRQAWHCRPSSRYTCHNPLARLL